METRSSKTFESGFVLSEQELHRLIDTTKDQFKKIISTSRPTESYEVQFANGSVSQTSLLSEVLELENHGSWIMPNNSS